MENKIDNNNNQSINTIQQHMVYQMVIFYAVTVVFVLTSNLMLIYGFYKTSRPFKIITKLFIYLSICEVAFILCYVLNSLNFTLKGNTSYYVIIFGLTYFIVLMALLIFWTISFLRFLSIFKPMYRIETRTVYKILLLEVFISLLVTTTISIGYMLVSSTIDELLNVNSKVGIGLNIVVIFINLSLNLSSLIILRRSTNSKARQKKDNVLGNPMVVKQKKMALNTLLLITIVHMLCNTPETGVSFFKLQLQFKYNYYLILLTCQCLQLSNFGINSMIVILRNKNLREFYRLKCCSHKFNITNTHNREIQLTEI